MATTPELHEPQIAAARAQAWHQAGEDALLTLEAARTWLNDFGMVLFAPRGGSLGAPAPSLVEATLGTAKSTVALGETETARGLVARLVGEGSALPLNLLGGPGDLPDFLVSAQAFPFVFTLRGDKGWKRPPETSGAVKVTPLALKVYELLAEKGSFTIAEIVPEIGREVTESAVARALGELWQMLRVLPVLQQGEGETRWELTTTRFLKAVKAGANAGQPTALSALASLYLTQVYVATEDEIAGFLSPLTARSRVREVLHGLVAGRQLAEGVIQGKTVLYMPDALPDFAEFAEPAVLADEADEIEEANPAEQVAAEGSDGEAANTEEGAPRERIRRFAEGDAGKERNLRGKPVRRESSAGSADRPKREGFRSGPRQDRGPREGGERRSFSPRGERPPRRDDRGERTGAGSGPRGAADRPSFARPWDEERADRPPREEGREDRPFRAREDRRPPRDESGEGRSPFRRREFPAAGQERGRGRFAGAGREGADRPQRPFRPRAEGEERPFRPRREGEERPSRPRREGGDRPFRPRTEGEDRPFRPRREGEERPFRARSEGGDRPFRPRREGDERPSRPRSEGGERAFRPRREGEDRPFRARPEGVRPYKPRPEGGERPSRPRPEGGGDRPFRSREGGAGREGGFRERRGPGGPSPGRFGGQRPNRFGGEDRGGAEGEERHPPRRPAFGGRPGGSGPPRGPRPEGAGFGGRREGRPSGPGGFRPAFKKAGFKKAGSKFAGSKFAGKTDRPSRAPRKPRSEDEA